jgi:hypothetical protein
VHPTTRRNAPDTALRTVARVAACRHRCVGAFGRSRPKESKRPALWWEWGSGARTVAALSPWLEPLLHSRAVDRPAHPVFHRRAPGVSKCVGSVGVVCLFQPGWKAQATAKQCIHLKEDSP